MRSVQGALEGLEGVTGIELDAGEKCGKFMAPEDMDVKKTLDMIVDGGNEHVKGWTMME